MRVVLLLVSLAFIVGLALLTVYDIVHNHGPTLLDGVTVLLIAFISVPLIGALSHRSSEADRLPDLEPPRTDHFR